MEDVTTGIPLRSVRIFLVVHVAVGATLSLLAWSDLDPADRWILAAGLVASAVTVGAHLRWSERENFANELLVAISLVGCWLLMVSVFNEVMFQQFTLMPAIYFLVPVRRAIVIAAIPMIVSVVDEIRDTETTGIVIAVTVGGWLGGAAMALWIQRIYVRSDAWQDMAMRLDAAQTELVRVERQAGADDARRRFAAEVHDTVAQSLTGIVLHCEDARRHALANEEVLASIGHIESVARAALTDARRLVSAAPETSLAIGDPIAAIRATVAAPLFAGLTIDVHVDGVIDDLDAPRSTTLHRIVLEALNNVAKHASATRVDVSVARIGDLVAIDVADDGRGFDPMASPSSVAGVVGGSGLRLLREQIELLGGSVEIESSEAGTVLSASLPAGSAHLNEASR